MPLTFGFFVFHRKQRGTIINRIGDHMEDVAATLMTDYHLEECQLDELWGYIFKKKRI